ncbi:hypothetical protein ACJ41O_012930 [Fusarium nematophilum]
MDSITEKIAKVTDLSTYADLTPDHLKKMFDEIGSSPEKLRTVLNLWFVPDFKPTFVEPQDHSLSGLQDIEFLETPDTEGAQRPLRLIDLETGNLVDSWNTSPLDSYCMLSHRWKGDEITLAHIRRARQNHMELMTGRDPDALAARDDDIYLVLEQCKRDVLKQERVILSFASKNSESVDVGTLLDKRIRGNDARGEVNWAQQNRNSKKAKVERCRIEKEMFDQIIQRIDHDINDSTTETTSTGAALQAASDVVDTTSTSHGNAATSTMVDEAYEEYATAQRKLESAINHQETTRDDVEFFRKNNRLGEAVDEMMSRLQRWKSAIKLSSSIEEARKIFRTRIFPGGGARYIWSDTCCIDKLNYGELSQSLSLMGDWYANAEFCLVHLDSDWRAADAVNDWNRFRREVKGEGDAQEANKTGIACFNAINGSNPEWSSRAWTLQELVMSKMCFFTNSEWKPLSRPVESLGYTYPLIPFIELYTYGVVPSIYSEALETEESRRAALSRLRDLDAPKSLLETSEVEIVGSDNEDQNASERVGEAVQLILILHALGFSFPADMTTETAISKMTQSVYLAAWSLTRDENDDSGGSGRKLLDELKNHLPSTARPDSPTSEREAQEAINFLLACLVAETKDLIVSDRESIAKFGQVNQLETWRRGTLRSGFPAQQVLQLSCRRRATVPVDHVYSLMGILGVRFQSFHAEGYPKALSRLLDEVIITCNDVSVFNWTGVEMGSPVRGRSLYPASHKAYGNDEDRGRRYNMMIAAEAQRKRKEVMFTYHGIIQMLQDAIDCVKTKGKKGIPLEWVRAISSFIRESSFDELGPELESLGKILVYIKDHCGQPPPPLPQVEKPSRAETSPAPAADEKAGWSLSMKPSLPGVKIPSMKPKIPSFGGISKPSFGRHHSEPVEKTVAEEPATKPSTPEAPKWLSLDLQVREYLKSLGSLDQGQERTSLPDPIQNLNFKAPEPERMTGNTRDDASSTPLGGLICPNPIIVNSSGIDGIFDIQRIIVTMVDREKLLRQVARATSPKQKISGWCTISTGFASVAVNFACEQHILRKQLDVEKAVEDKLIKEDRAKKLHVDLEILKSAKVKEGGDNADKENRSGGGEIDKETKEASSRANEEQTIVRIIDFIQEPQLQLVAGEWVLARFSGVRGAKWFLCYLELGSTHQFYGHRIATSDIDFANSAVEPGLVNAWQTYMARKKRKMCGILNTYVNSFESAAKSEEKLKITSEMASTNYGRIVDAGNQSLERVMSMGSVSPTMLKLPFSENVKEVKKPVEDDSEDDETRGDFFGELIDQGKEAAMALGEYTVLAAYEKICELHAKHLDKHLATSVLKKTPKSLQTAVESVDENKGFLPAMFHSSRRVHMF